MRIRRIVMVGLGVGVVALAVAGCTGTALGEGNGQGGAHGYRGARYTHNTASQQQATRRNALGQQARSAGDTARGALRGPGDALRGPGDALHGPGDALRGAVKPASERTGRDVSDAGTLRTLTGMLTIDGTEWYLNAADGRFLLHLGKTSFIEQTGLVLEAGETVLVKGLVDADEVSVVSLQMGGETYTLRSEDGRPLWAGGGRGGGWSAGQGPGRGGGFGG